MQGIKDNRVQSLIERAKSWDIEAHKYICQDFDGWVYFSNELENNGVACWDVKSFLGFLEEHCDLPKADLP